MNNNLIYDIGLHNGYDTKMYLEKGYDVIAIEANIDLVRKAETRFSKEIKEGRLKVINCAISDVDDQTLNFFVSELDTISSLNEEMASRAGNVKTYQIKTKTLCTIFKTYGKPYYCKIDIEGYDHIAIKGLIDNFELSPKFISVENNNLSDNGTVSELIKNETDLIDLWVSSLERLKLIGYNKFKLVDQVSLEVFDKNSKYVNSELYFKNNIVTKLINKFLRVKTCLKTSFSMNKSYLTDCSGPFGEELAYNWLNFEEAKESIIYHAKRSLKYKKATMWCDIHATV
jgi:FkbM family methyltransferase